jgi:hypothetical protein
MTPVKKRKKEREGRGMGRVLIGKDIENKKTPKKTSEKNPEKDIGVLYYRIIIVTPSAPATAKPPIIVPNPSKVNARLPTLYAAFDVEAAVPVASKLAVPVPTPVPVPVELALVDRSVTPAASRSDR